MGGAGSGSGLGGGASACDAVSVKTSGISQSQQSLHRRHLSQR